MSLSLAVMAGLSVADFGLSVVGGIMGASAQRESARAQMAALKSEKAWNLGVMAQNIVDVKERGMLESYASGIDPMTGSNFAVIESNERTMRNQMEFQAQQYDVQMKNLRAQSKQKYLGLF